MTTVIRPIGLLIATALFATFAPAQLWAGGFNTAPADPVFNFGPESAWMNPAGMTGVKTPAVTASFGVGGTNGYLEGSGHYCGLVRGIQRGQCGTVRRFSASHLRVDGGLRQGLGETSGCGRRNRSFSLDQVMERLVPPGK